jgi:hypothetical protein
MREPISLCSTVTLTTDQVSADLNGEVVILHFGSGVYYSLDVVGARVWQLIQSPTTVEKIRNSLLEEYDVPLARCEQDLLTLLEHLAAEGLIEVSYRAEGGCVAPSSEESR